MSPLVAPHHHADLADDVDDEQRYLTGGDDLEPNVDDDQATSSDSATPVAINSNQSTANVATIDVAPEYHGYQISFSQCWHSLCATRTTRI